MFPIGDDNSDRTITPYVNYAIIAACVLVFVLLQGLGGNEAFNYAFSLVPREITTGTDIASPQVLLDAAGRYYVDAKGQPQTINLQPTPISVYITFLTSMFMHGGFSHILGNMMFLWVFGDNLENMLGHVRYLAFYLVCGIAAALSQVLMDTNSIIPMLGASGAISGVLGGYILLFPRRRVRALIFNFLTEVPAFVALGLWIAYQVIQGYFSSAETGGVAYAAHIGGFVAGVVLIKLFAIGRTVTPPSARA